MILTDMRLTDHVSRHEINGREVDGPNVWIWNWRAWTWWTKCRGMKLVDMKMQKIRQIGRTWSSLTKFEGHKIDRHENARHVLSGWAWIYRPIFSRVWFIIAHPQLILGWCFRNILCISTYYICIIIMQLTLMLWLVFCRCLEKELHTAL